MWRCAAKRGQRAVQQLLIGTSAAGSNLVACELAARTAASPLAAAAAAAAGSGGSATAVAALAAAAATRGFGSSSGLSMAAAVADAADASKELAAALAKELKHEEAVYEQDELVAGGPPAPFVLSTATGDTAMTLTREFGANEVVTVDVSVSMQDELAMPFDEDDDEDDEEDNEGEEDEDDDEEEPGDVNFNVTVTRGEHALVFECVGDGTYVDVRHVSLEPAGGADSETAYTGPVFGELDADLQDAFRSFLRQRGVDEDLCEWLRHAVYDKEVVEYKSWLRRVKDFVSHK